MIVQFRTIGVFKMRIWNQAKFENNKLIYFSQENRQNLIEALIWACVYEAKLRRRIQESELDGYYKRLEVKGDESIHCTESGKFRKLFGKSVKIDKNKKIDNVYTKVFYGASYNRVNPKINSCPFATKGCVKLCLGHTTGHMTYPQNQKVQILKTLFWYSNPQMFIRRLIIEIVNHCIVCARKGYRAGFRLNGSTDIPWARFIDIEMLSEILEEEFGQAPIFYDYTKYPYESMVKACGELPDPSRYHLTYSINEGKDSIKFARQWISEGHGACVVIRSKDGKIKSTRQLQLKICDQEWFEIDGVQFHPINADLSDARFYDPKGSIGILHAKGREALTDESGFVRIY
jgi:hypothetical protein